MTKFRGNLKAVLVAVTVAVVAGVPAVAAVVADFAKNADKVDRKHAVGAGASTAKRRGKLVATNSQGFLPNNILRKAVNANKLDGIDSASFQQDYDGVVVVAKSGGDFTTIQEAIASTSPNASERHVVYVAPGTYDEQVTMKPNVDVVGSGRDATIISCDCGDATPDGEATVTLASSSSLSDLQVTNSSSDSNGVALRGDDLDQSRLGNLAVIASGGTNANIGLSLHSSVVDLFRVNASAFDGSALSVAARLFDSSIRWRHGELQSSSSSDPVGIEARDTGDAGFSDVGLVDVDVSASSGDVGNTAILVNAGGLDLRDSTALAGGPAGGTGIDASDASIGVTNSQIQAQGPSGTGIEAVDSSLTVRGSRVSGVGSADSHGIDFLPTTTGRDLEVSHSEIRKLDSGDGAALHSTIAVGDSSITIRNSRLAALGGAGDVWAVSTERTGGTATLTIDSSQLESVDGLLENGTSWTTSIGATRLDGGTVSNSGTLTCVHSYNGAYTAVSSACT